MPFLGVRFPALVLFSNEKLHQERYAQILLIVFLLVKETYQSKQTFHPFDEFHES